MILKSILRPINYFSRKTDLKKFNIKKNDKNNDHDKKTLKKFYTENMDLKQHPLEKLYWDKKFSQLKVEGKTDEIKKIKALHNKGELYKERVVKEFWEKKNLERKTDIINVKESKDNNDWTIDDKSKFIKIINKEMTIKNPSKVLNTLPILLVHKIIETNYVKEIDVPKLIVFLNYFIKHKIFKRIDGTYLENYIVEICKNKINVLSENIISTLVNNLNNLKCTNEEIWLSLAIGILQKANKFSLRSICNILNSFISINNNLNYSSFNNALYKPLIPLILAKLKNEGFNRHDLLGIFVSYSKTNNLDKEFLDVLVNLSINNFHILTTKEIVNISHIMYIKNYDNIEYLNIVVNYFSEFQEKFKFSELMIWYKVIENYKLVNKKIFKLYNSRILTNFDLINIQDFNIINSVHIRNISIYNKALFNETFIKKLNECFTFLKGNLDKSNIIDLLIGYGILNEYYNGIEIRLYGRNIRDLIKFEYNNGKINNKLKSKIIDAINENIKDTKNAKLYLNKLT